MRILIASVANVDSPEISLIDSLLYQGVEFCIAGYGLADLPPSVLDSPAVEVVDLGNRAVGSARLRQNAETRRRLRRLLDDRGKEFDCIWTVNELTVRDIGKRLLQHRHIAQLYELCEHVPAFLRRELPFKSNATLEICRHADAVVVPEYNRACIVRTWWGLPKDPIVLPNKPRLLSRPSEEAVRRASDAFRDERRKVLLYQGIFAPERQLEPFAECLELLDDEFALYLMGKLEGEWQRNYLDKLLAIDHRVRYLGSEKAPDHLAYTQFGHIGLLVYVPQKSGYFSPLNGLYCAPNKLWEYAQAGLPMLSNNLPGLRSAFEEGGMGITSSLDPVSLARAVRELDDGYEQRSRNAREYFDTVDIDRIIAQVIGL